MQRLPKLPVAPSLALLLIACSSGAPAKDAGPGVKIRDAGLAPRASDAGGPEDAAVDSDAVVVDHADAGHMQAAIDAGKPGKPDSSVTVLTDSGLASCQNGLHDGRETDIDCGGADCGACLSGRHCEQGTDCASGECKDGSCTCLPLRACPKGACGTVRNCGGELDCGACASGVCYENQCCTPRVCASDECGVFADGCGGTVRCGAASCCTPRTCDHPSLSDRCGDFDDRCGGSVTCACADSHATCYLGACCTPNACDGTSCGVPISNGCGGVATCSCASGKRCYQAHCCQPLDCSAWVGPGCSEMSDGCGGMLSCGCTTGQRCQNGSCCTAVGCAAGIEHDACGSEVGDGCGGTQICSCASGLSCYQTHCCASKTCSEQSLDHRCGPNTDGCGVSGLWCGCGTTTTIHVARRGACGHACADTLTKVAACTASAALEVLDQSAGWDFPQTLSSSACNASYGFSPAFSGCSGTGFQLDAQGFIYLDVGTQCFSITGRKQNSCGALYFVSTPDSFTGWDALPGSTAATLVSGHAPVCFDITKADYYPIRWHYTQDAGLEDFHVNYCAGGPTGCVPIPSSMLRPALP
jgi:hypothetical protein